MPSLFTRIINGEIPGRFVWKDDKAVAFLTIRPIRAGHTLIVPREEVDHWIDLKPALAHHVMDVAQSVAKAIQHGFKPVKVGVMVAGLEVPHTHLHLVPIQAIGDLDFAKQRDATPAELDSAAATIRASLRALGFPQVSG